MAAGQIVTTLSVREDSDGKTFLEACHKIQPCGCEVVGSGTLQDLLDIKYCPAHAAISIANSELLAALEHTRDWMDVASQKDDLRFRVAYRIVNDAIMKAQGAPVPSAEELQA